MIFLNSIHSTSKRRSKTYVICFDLVDLCMDLLAMENDTSVRPKHKSNLDYNIILVQSQRRLFKLSLTQGEHAYFGMISHASVE